MAALLGIPGSAATVSAATIQAVTRSRAFMCGCNPHI